MAGKNMKTMDGNTAAAHASYAFTEVAAIYPITPSSVMAEVTDEWSANGKKNIFGQEVKIVEMESEGGAAGAVHGSLLSGALTTTYTASQGLLLMIPNMFKIAAEYLPTVFHVSARAISTHALSIFGDHSDVMAARSTGFAMLSSASVQEVMDLGSVAHLSAIKSNASFLHFFDGFRTSHEIQKIETIDYDVYRELIDMDAVNAFRQRSLTPEHPKMMGTAQNPDVFFQNREAQNRHFEDIADVVADYMNRLGDKTGRYYKPFDYVGAPDAEYVIVAMGSVCETIEEVIPLLMKEGRKVGLIKVRLYRPFSAKHFLSVLPESCKKIAVLDRTKEPGSIGEPLFLDVKSLLYGKDGAPEVYGGRYGLASKDTTPGQIVAVYKNLESDTPKADFTIGIVDDVTNKSLDAEPFVSEPEGTVRCKFWGLGSDGTVGANKSAIKIIGDNTDMYAQGYFEYDSKKSGGITISHLRFGNHPIKSTYFVSEADFVACHNPAYVNQYEIVQDLRKGGTFLLNCIWTPEELEEHLPGSMKRYIAQNEINFYTINAVDIGQKIGLGNRINMIMQSAFFALTKVIPVEDAIRHLKEAVVKNYGFMGDDIVEMNNAAIDQGATAFHKVEVPASWADAPLETAAQASDQPEFITEILRPISRQQGKNLPVSTFTDDINAMMPSGTSAYEKRGVATNVPEWNKDTCIQCNICALSCPHATIRPVLVNKDGSDGQPEGFETVPAKGKEFEAYDFRMQVSPLDCLGCGVCVDVCPTKTKSLTMKPIASQEKEIPNWEFAEVQTKKDFGIAPVNIKNSQFNTPFLEYSGACAGCGETPYAKLVTQLFGKNLMIANATGCSSIWGASYPSAPYTVNADGRGPAWANSLFEDNAEFGLGMATASKRIREKVRDDAEILAADASVSAEVKEAVAKYLETYDDREANDKPAHDMIEVLEAASLSGEAAAVAQDLLDRKDFAAKRSIWLFGGDGWAYDIGYGGLDHVLASNENVNVMVFDTEVYSNTGGQSSKATPKAAIALFAASGKKVKKKDLGLEAMGYGYVYVAQIALGADRNQALKAIREAEAYDGPSLIIAYATCINHGVKTGMNTSQTVMKEAVEAGYWHLYRYNPELKEAGKNPFTLDSKEPSASFRDFLMNEVRYSQLISAFPDDAEDLFTAAEEDAKKRYQTYKRLSELEQPIF